ncbi:hypothetical protein V500_09906 [Pseudogymnoascus sp. VKM F-4518 (FW-2643)]|nr:hypothetical protein V500_09906 [Pseudogymnoascus sp. VKM F-4518 (FW-2643)]
MEPPVTPPRERRSSLRQVHRHQQDAHYASPPKTPMWRSEPQTLPTANTSRKRGRENWTPPTPTSLPRRKRGQDAAGLSAEKAAGDGDGENLFERNGPLGTETEVSHRITANEPLANGESLANERQYIAFATYWDEDIIGVVCPFCMETEIHIMPRPSNAADVDLRVPDCDPRKKFRLLFAGDDHPAVKGRRGIWMEDRRRWEIGYVDDLCSEESEQGGEAEEYEESTTEEPIFSGDQDHGDPVEVLEDTEEDQSNFPSEGVLPLAADSGVDLPVAFNDDGDEAITDNLTPNENAQILRLAAGLYDNPPPEYLTLGHGTAAIVYRPVAVIPILGAQQKTVGFLAPTASSSRRVFARSGWKGENISDGDIAWLQGILATAKEAPWQKLTIINNREYTNKVRYMSAHLGLEPKYHNYDKKNPLGQVCFSHVEKQLVVVALEEHQCSSHLSPTEPLINRMIFLDRAPCAGCLDFAKAVERTVSIRFEFNVMTRVMSDEQARTKFRKLDSGKGAKDREADDNADETPPDDQIRQGPQRPTRARRGNEHGEYEITAILGKKQSIRDGLQYLVHWQNTWLTDSQIEAQVNGLYAGELEVIGETTGRKGERRRLVQWADSWMDYGDLNNARKLIEEYESKKGLLE